MTIYYTKEGKYDADHILQKHIGFLHRENGPAVYDKTGYELWCIDGKNHRLDGPAIIAYDYKEWWVNGERHRKNGPAIEHRDGGKEYYKSGKCHRLSGPSIISSAAENEYWIFGKKVNTEEVETWIRENNINLKTKEHQALFMLRFG